MGLVLDSSILVAAERERQPVSELLVTLAQSVPDSEFVLCALTVMELEHGYHRARTPELAMRRRRYLDEIYAVFPIEPFTREIAARAARVDAELRISGVVISTADLLIAATALHLGFGVSTHNVRHFRVVPNLRIIMR